MHDSDTKFPNDQFELMCPSKIENQFSSFQRQNQLSNWLKFVQIVTQDKWHMHMTNEITRVFTLYHDTEFIQYMTVSQYVRVSLALTQYTTMNEHCSDSESEPCSNSIVVRDPVGCNNKTTQGVPRAVKYKYK